MHLKNVERGIKMNEEIMSQEVLEFINNFDKDYLEGKSYIFEKFEYDDFTLE